LLSTHFTNFWLVAAAGVAIVAFSVIRKSWLSCWIGISCLDVGLLLVLDFYQGVVGKPYLISANVLAISGTLGIVAFIVGLFIVTAAFLDKEYFRLSNY
jgi:hypothetical protein